MLGAGIAEFDSVFLAPRAQRRARFGLLELVPLPEHASIGEEDLQAAVRALAPEERRNLLGICRQSLLNESLDESKAEIQFGLTRNGQVPVGLFKVIREFLLEFQLVRHEVDFPGYDIDICSIVEGASDADELECVHQLGEFDGDSQGSPPVDACGLASDPDDTAAAGRSLCLAPDALYELTRLSAASGATLAVASE